MNNKVFVALIIGVLIGVAGVKAATVESAQAEVHASGPFQISATAAAPGGGHFDAWVVDTMTGVVSACIGTQCIRIGQAFSK